MLSGHHGGNASADFLLECDQSAGFVVALVSIAPNLFVVHGVCQVNGYFNSGPVLADVAVEEHGHGPSPRWLHYGRRCQSGRGQP